MRRHTALVQEDAHTFKKRMCLMPPTHRCTRSLTQQICHQAPHQFASPFLRCSWLIAGCTHLLLLLLLLYSLDLSCCCCCCCPQLNFLAPQCSCWTSSPFMILLFMFFSSMTFDSFFSGSRLGGVAVEWVWELCFWLCNLWASCSKPGFDLQQ